MSSICYTREAKQDFQSHHGYIAVRSPKKGHEFILRMIDLCDLILDNPLMGVEREELLPGLRNLADNKYLSFYRLKAGGILVMRVLRGEYNTTSADFSCLDNEPLNP